MKRGLIELSEGTEGPAAAGLAVNRGHLHAPSDSRDHLADTLKGLMIVLVVFGHTIEPVPLAVSMKGGGVWSLLYCVLYMFHMPVFVFVSGYLSSSRKGVLAAARDPLILYIVAEALWVTFLLVLMVLGMPRPGLADLLGIRPGWGLWYLLSLFFWRASVPVLLSARRPSLWLIGLAFCGACAGISTADTNYSLSRTIAFYPFFAAGVWAKQCAWMLIRRRALWMDVFAIGAIVLVAPVVIAVGYHESISLFHLATPFRAHGVYWLTGIGFRLGLYVSALAVIRMLFVAMPVTKSGVGFLGRRSLAIYLGHYYVLHLVRQVLPPDAWISNMRWLSPTLTAFCCAVFSLVPVAGWITTARSRVDALMFADGSSQGHRLPISSEGVSDRA